MRFAGGGGGAAVPTNAPPLGGDGVLAPDRECGDGVARLRRMLAGVMQPGLANILALWAVSPRTHGWRRACSAV